MLGMLQLVYYLPLYVKQTCWPCLRPPLYTRPRTGNQIAQTNGIYLVHVSYKHKTIFITNSYPRVHIRVSLNHGTRRKVANPRRTSKATPALSADMLRYISCVLNIQISIINIIAQHINSRHDLPSQLAIAEYGAAMCIFECQLIYMYIMHSTRAGSNVNAQPTNYDDRWAKPI